MDTYIPAYPLLIKDPSSFNSTKSLIEREAISQRSQLDFKKEKRWFAKIFWTNFFKMVMSNLELLLYTIDYFLALCWNTLSFLFKRTYSLRRQISQYWWKTILLRDLIIWKAKFCNTFERRKLLPCNLLMCWWKYSISSWQYQETHLLSLTVTSSILNPTVYFKNKPV